MLILLNKTSLYSTFGVDSFESLDSSINSIAPSMVEYYLSNLSLDTNDAYLNKRNIQNSICIGEYSIYLDYDEEVYLEIEDSFENSLETGTLW